MAVKQERGGRMKKALIWTAGPILALSVLSMLGKLGPPNIDQGLGALYWLWFIAGGVWVAAIVAAVLLAVVGRRREARGVALGIAIGAVALASTCIANVSGVDMFY